MDHSLQDQFQNILFNHAERVDRVELLYVSTRSTRLITFEKKVFPVPPYMRSLILAFTLAGPLLPFDMERMPV